MAHDEGLVDHARATETRVPPRTCVSRSGVSRTGGLGESPEPNGTHLWSTRNPESLSQLVVTVCSYEFIFFPFFSRSTFPSRARGAAATPARAARRRLRVVCPHTPDKRKRLFVKRLSRLAIRHSSPLRLLNQCPMALRVSVSRLATCQGLSAPAGAPVFSATLPEAKARSRQFFRDVSHIFARAIARVTPIPPAPSPPNQTWLGLFHPFSDCFFTRVAECSRFKCWRGACEDPCLPSSDTLNRISR